MGEKTYGPASYFPAIEAKYGRPIGEWLRIVADTRDKKHMEIVNFLKTEYNMGHGHADALVGFVLRDLKGDIGALK